MQEVRNKKITTVKQYKKKYKKYNWPSTPHVTYKKEWISYNNFFGTYKYECKKISLRDLMREVRNKKITSAKKYRSVCKKYKWPVQPHTTYEKQWVSYDNFLGKISYKCKKISLKDLIQEVRNQKISNCNQYRKAYKKYNWPAAPCQTYKKDWISWNHFFGNEEKKFLTWKEIRIDVKKHKVTTMDQYRELRKNTKGHLWPSNPDKAYKEWTSTRHFFTDVVFPDWEDFCNQVRDSKIKNSTEYKQKRRENWPKSPSNVYGENWKGWNYLFYGELKDNNWLDFKTLHPQVLEMNLKNQDDYKKKRKRGWPSHPDAIYKEFKGWTHFLQGKTAEETSNEICTQLCNFIKKNKRMPSKCPTKCTGKDEKRLSSYLERRRRGDQDIFDSDLEIAKKMGFPNLFVGKDPEKESNKICLELCKFIKTNKRLPSAKSKNKYERSLKSWMWSRFTCQDKKWQKKSYPSDVEILKKEKLYDFINGN
jgi:hypothetical protein